jgi:hypothetical protein
MLKPGTYRLRIDVTNPDPDGRYKHDWRRHKTWEAGAVFIAVDIRHPVLAGERLTTLQLVGGRGYLYPSEYAALEVALEPIAETHEAMFTRLDCTSCFAKWLVESGRVSAADFEKLWNIYENPAPEHHVEHRGSEAEELRKVIEGAIASLTGENDDFDGLDQDAIGRTIKQSLDRVNARDSLARLAEPKA